MSEVESKVIQTGPDGDDLVVSYWSVARALGRAISNLSHDNDPWNSFEMWSIVEMLCQEMPEWDWSNAISDHFTPKMQVRIVDN